MDTTNGSEVGIHSRRLVERRMDTINGKEDGNHKMEKVEWKVVEQKEDGRYGV